jgi:hypothetical protein
MRPFSEVSTVDQDSGRDDVHCTFFVISNATQYREAISRLRMLEGAAKHSSLGDERDTLELAVSRYLLFGERPGAESQVVRH